MVMCLIIMAVVVAADQITKWLAVTYLGSGTVSVIPHILGFSLTYNSGAVGGVFADSRWMFMIPSVIFIALLLYYLFRYKPKQNLVRVSISIIAGGGIGNMIDRVLAGEVTDFIDTPFIPWIAFEKSSSFPFFRCLGFVDYFPLWNIADGCIVVGGIILAVYVIVEMIREIKKEKSSAKPEESAGEPAGSEETENKPENPS